MGPKELDDIINVNIQRDYDVNVNVFSVMC